MRIGVKNLQYLKTRQTIQKEAVRGLEGGGLIHTNVCCSALIKRHRSDSRWLPGEPGAAGRGGCYPRLQLESLLTWRMRVQEESLLMWREYVRRGVALLSLDDMFACLARRICAPPLPTASPHLLALHTALHLLAAALASCRL